jgi:transposase
VLENEATEPITLASATRIALLEAQLHEQSERLTERDAQLLARDQRIKQLEEILRLLKAGRFGVSREKLQETPGQGALFNEVEVLAELIALAGQDAPLNATPERENKKPSKDKPGRKALASHLPRIEVRHELPEADRVCACGGVRTEISTEPSEQLDYVPAKIQVIRHLRVKYACSACEAGSVSIAPVPAQMLPKTNAAPGLLAQIVTSKYVDALPLYRQEQIFARHGINLSRATQAAWIIGLIEPLTPLLNLMDERLRESGYIRMDETPLQVLKSDKAPQSDHWMWVRVSGPPRERIIIFDYHPSRSSEAAERLLTGTSGYLQTDGYTAYDGVANKLHLTHVGCMAHARRRFFEAIKALPKDQANTITAAHEAVRRIDALYAIERDLKALKDPDPQQRQTVRRARAIPLLGSLHAWALARQAETLPSGKLGDAFAYLLTQWPKLVRYLNDPRLALDTNVAENAIRPFALGRRNWLFADTVKGAKASAALFSLIETAKANGLEPFAYLRSLFEKLPLAKSIDDIEKLLPFNQKSES